MADAARVCQDLGFDILDHQLRLSGEQGGEVQWRLRAAARSAAGGTRCCAKVRAAITIPFTMKYRAGWNDHELVAVPMAQARRRLRAAGDRAASAHARAGLQRARPTGRRIAEVKAAVKIPVIGNGDIVTPEDAVRMVRGNATATR